MEFTEEEDAEEFLSDRYVANIVLINCLSCRKQKYTSGAVIVCEAGLSQEKYDICNECVKVWRTKLPNLPNIFLIGMLSYCIKIPKHEDYIKFRERTLK